MVSKKQWIIIGITIISILSIVTVMFYSDYRYNEGYTLGLNIGRQDGFDYAIDVLAGEMCVNKKTFLCNNNQTICGCVDIGGNANESNSGL